MEIKHIHLDELYRAYSTNTMVLDGELNLFFASEEKDYPCYAYSGEDFKTRKTVWDKGGGGTMSIIPLEKRPNEFIAVIDFYLKSNPSESKLVWGRYDKNEGFIIKDFLYLPFLHRFDVYVIDGVEYLVCATVSDHKEGKDDWRVAGSIYAAKLPDDLTTAPELKQIKTGLFRNHGYFRDYDDGQVVGYFTSDSGVDKLIPCGDIDNWKFEHIMDGKVGEAVFMDINDDGIKEMMTIEEFHGNQIKIYEKIDGEYREVFKYGNKIDFAHSLVPTTLGGKKCFLAGVRREEAEMFYVEYVDGKYVSHVIDKGCGPANMSVVHLEDKDIITSSNHTRNECAIYVIEK